MTDIERAIRADQKTRYTLCKWLGLASFLDIVFIALNPAIHDCIKSGYCEFLYIVFKYGYWYTIGPENFLLGIITISAAIVSVGISLSTLTLNNLHEKFPSSYIQNYLNDGLVLKPTALFMTVLILSIFVLLHEFDHKIMIGFSIFIFIAFIGGITNFLQLYQKLFRVNDIFNIVEDLKAIITEDLKKLYKNDCIDIDCSNINKYRIKLIEDVDHSVKFLGEIANKSLHEYNFELTINCLESLKKLMLELINTKNKLHSDKNITIPKNDYSLTQSPITEFIIEIFIDVYRESVKNNNTGISKKIIKNYYEILTDIICNKNTNDELNVIINNRDYDDPITNSMLADSLNAPYSVIYKLFHDLLRLPLILIEEKKIDLKNSEHQFNSIKIFLKNIQHINILQPIFDDNIRMFEIQLKTIPDISLWTVFMKHINDLDDELRSRSNLDNENVEEIKLYELLYKIKYEWIINFGKNQCSTKDVINSLNEINNKLKNNNRNNILNTKIDFIVLNIDKFWIMNHINCMLFLIGGFILYKSSDPIKYIEKLWELELPLDDKYHEMICLSLKYNILYAICNYKDMLKSIIKNVPDNIEHFKYCALLLLRYGKFCKEINLDIFELNNEIKSQKYNGLILSDGVRKIREYLNTISIIPNIDKIFTENNIENYTDDVNEMLKKLEEKWKKNI